MPRYLLRSLILVPFLAVAACQSTAPKINAPLPQPSNPVAPLPVRENLAPIAYDGTLVDLPRGANIGGYEFVLYECFAADTHIIWEPGRINDDDAEVSTEVEKVLWNKGLNVPGGSGGLFTQSFNRAESPLFLLGAKVKNISASLCRDWDTWKGVWSGKESGKALLSIEWQLFSVFERRVVFEKSLPGYYEVTEPRESQSFLFSLFVGAIADSAQTLVADEAFIGTLRRNTGLQTAGAEPTEPLILEQRKRFNAPVAEQIEDIRDGVVVVGAGKGHGSGFFITPTLLLTNYHVVGESREAPIEFRDGRRVIASVLRRDARRDVALLQLQEGEGKPLPVRTEPLAVTEEVLAVGAPLVESLSGTVTRGIVSNFILNQEGLPVIQADVDIQGGNSGGALIDANGNAVGISYAGVDGGRSGTSIGVNFFIPILEGLKHLNVQLN